MVSSRFGMSPQQQPLNSQLADLRNQLALCSTRGREVVAGLYPDQLTLRPEPGKWSIAECLVHLSLTSASFLPLIEVACDEARRQELRSDGPFKMEAVASLLKWSLEPPARIRISTRDQFQPLIFEPVDEVLPNFIHLQGKLDQALNTASGLDLGRVKVASPFSTRLKYNLFSCFVLIAAHQRRHFWQAEEVRKWVLDGKSLNAHSR
jgi:hypothetical protein